MDLRSTLGFSQDSDQKVGLKEGEGGDGGDGE